MDSTSFRYMLALTVHLLLDISLFDVVTTYMYGNFDTTLYLTPLLDFLPSPISASLGKFSGLKLQKALYGLK